MTELAAWYLPLKHAHVTLVGLSVALFALRGLAVLALASWPVTRGARVASVVIDTALLTTGAGLWAALSLNPLTDHWLGAKLLLLLVYIVLGTFALHRARSPRARAICYIAALGCVAFMASIALAHDPRGWLAGA